MVHLSEQTKNLLEGVNYRNNLLVVSSLKEFYHPIKSHGFAIKYVLNGVEHYTLNGQAYPVGAGNYLLSNNTSDGHVEIDKGEFVKGICINIVPELLADVVASCQRPDTAYPDANLGHFFSSHLFLEQQYSATNTRLGHLLRQLHTDFLQNDLLNSPIENDFFYTLSELIVADQIPVFKQLHSIPSLKPSTKKDLYRRLHRGKECIDALFQFPLAIETVATEACLSEYHFFRLFKQVFGQTPHQYLHQKRLNHAAQLLGREQASVTEAAIASGFADIHSFSKAFKKHFGVSPTNWLQKESF